jgi:hypothetical protein
MALLHGNTCWSSIKDNESGVSLRRACLVVVWGTLNTDLLDNPHDVLQSGTGV